MTRTLLKPTEVAHLLKLTPQTVRAMCARGEIRCLKIGAGKRTTYRIFREFIDDLLGKQSPASSIIPKEKIDGQSDIDYIENWGR
jgi:excisionase family DNA binding protein